MNTVFLLLGGNIGDTVKFLKSAVSGIESRVGRVIKKSSLFKSEAWPLSKREVKQNDFFNQVILAETLLSPSDLLNELLKIERSLGRIRSGKKWEERIIDIDILFYLTGGLENRQVIINEENLKIPHPFLHLRRFTLEPLNEIAPDLVHPVFKKTISELLTDCADKLKVEKSLLPGSYMPVQKSTGLLSGNVDGEPMFGLSSSPLGGNPPLADWASQRGSGEGPYNFIAIEGNIGSGKTSLAEKISAQFNARLMLEQFAENPFLPKFYKDREKYAFPLEMSFLAERYNQVKEELNTHNMFHPVTVSDYTISKCLVFAKINLQSDEYNLYNKLFNIIYPTLPKPDLLVYLYLTTEQLLANILKRGRNYEREISPEYLMNIQEGYFEFLRQQPELRVLLIDTSHIDFVNNKADYEKIVEIIHKPHPLGISRFLL